MAAPAARGYEKSGVRVAAAGYIFRTGARLEARRTAAVAKRPPYAFLDAPPQYVENLSPVPAVRRNISMRGRTCAWRNIQEALKEAIRLNLGDVDQQNAREKAQLEKQLIANKAERKEVSHNLIRGVIPERTAQELLVDYEQQETEIRLKLKQVDSEVEDVEELMEFGISKLSNLAQTFTEITDPNIRFRFQNWLFPVGLVVDGERFGTSKMPLILSVKQSTLAGVLGEINHVVGEMGFEPIRLLVSGF